MGACSRCIPIHQDRWIRVWERVGGQPRCPVGVGGSSATTHAVLQHPTPHTPNTSSPLPPPELVELVSAQGRRDADSTSAAPSAPQRHNPHAPTHTPSVRASGVHTRLPADAHATCLLTQCAKGSRSQGVCDASHGSPGHLGVPTGPSGSCPVNIHVPFVTRQTPAAQGQHTNTMDAIGPVGYQ